MGKKFKKFTKFPKPIPEIESQPNMNKIYFFLFTYMKDFGENIARYYLRRSVGYRSAVAAVSVSCISWVGGYQCARHASVVTRDTVVHVSICR